METDYTAESWANFARALENAKTVAADENADQTAVDEATALLNEAMGALVAAEPEPPVEADKTALAALIAEAEDFNRTDYTAESWAPFAEALTNAYSVNQNAAASQEDVDNAAAALKAAMEALVYIRGEVDLAPIREAIAAAQKLDKDAYTAESWEAMQRALAEAITAASDPTATQEMIDQKLAALQEAVDALVKAEGGQGTGSGEGTGSGQGTGQGTDQGQGSGGQADKDRAVRTGDESPIFLYGILMIVMAGAVVLIVAVRRRRR